MGWGTSFKKDVYISKRCFKSVFELEDVIEELREDIVQREKEILMYVSGRPSDFIPSDWEDEGVMFLKNRVEELFLFYKEDLDNLRKLEFFRDYLKDNPEKDIKDFCD